MAKNLGEVLPNGKSRSSKITERTGVALALLMPLGVTVFFSGKMISDTNARFERGEMRDAEMYKEIQQLKDEKLSKSDFREVWNLHRAQLPLELRATVPEAPK